MDPQQDQAFKEAVERKKAEADAKSRNPNPELHSNEEARSQALQDAERKISRDGGSQDDQSIRDKNTQKGKVTADKWNQ